MKHDKILLCYQAAVFNYSRCVSYCVHMPFRSQMKGMSNFIASLIAENALLESNEEVFKLGRNAALAEVQATVDDPIRKKICSSVEIVAKRFFGVRNQTHPQNATKAKPTDTPTNVHPPHAPVRPHTPTVNVPNVTSTTNKTTPIQANQTKPHQPPVKQNATQIKTPVHTPPRNVTTSVNNTSTTNKTTTVNKTTTTTAQNHTHPVKINDHKNVTNLTTNSTTNKTSEQNKTAVCMNNTTNGTAQPLINSKPGVGPVGHLSGQTAASHAPTTPGQNTGNAVGAGVCEAAKKANQSPPPPSSSVTTPSAGVPTAQAAQSSSSHGWNQAKKSSMKEKRSNLRKHNKGKKHKHHN
eukprot:TRINITY_DN10816_c0_g1_i2.p1 TRINITY_DN10816_c0_g1~~TRINITY_DN10816_c0_g1_i2.p1  ORF type:complete len:352 (-),score=59.53 TRINITY_DN10816_c0_g1_i2:127-1182(-)